MNNIYINVAFGALVAFASILPGVSDAYSVVNNNYNNNVNTNTNQPVMYAGNYADQNRGSVVYTANQNLYTTTYVAPSAQRVSGGYIYHNHTETACASCSYASYRLVNHSRCGAAVSIADVRVPKPTCSLVPAITPSGAIELQWTTHRATVAFIDNGIGHIATVSGSRIVTPQEDTAYNLTVLNDAGIAGTCGAKVNVKVTVDPDPVDPDPTDPDPVDPDDPDNGGSLFGSTFGAIALPIGIVFLVLMVLLVIIMSKVKKAH